MAYTGLDSELNFQNLNFGQDVSDSEITQEESLDGVWECPAMKVFIIPELLEKILLSLPGGSLIRYRGVHPIFNSMINSPDTSYSIKRHCWRLGTDVPPNAASQAPKRKQDVSDNDIRDKRQLVHPLLNVVLQRVWREAVAAKPASHPDVQQLVGNTNWPDDISVTQPMSTHISISPIPPEELSFEYHPSITQFPSRETFKCGHKATTTRFAAASRRIFFSNEEVEDFMCGYLSEYARTEGYPKGMSIKDFAEQIYPHFLHFLRNEADLQRDFKDSIPISIEIYSSFIGEKEGSDDGLESSSPKYAWGASRIAAFECQRCCDIMVVTYLYGGGDEL